jgi:calcineurin-like phosphoesterase family protein
MYLKNLNGKHYLIRGNHDSNQVDTAGFIWVKATAMVKIEDNYVWLSHYAHRVWNRAHYGVPHFFGHTHGSLRNPEKRSLDVGVDCWNYAPVSWEKLKGKF